MSETKETLNKALVLEAFDTLFNKRDYSTAERFWSNSYIQHSALIARVREFTGNVLAFSSGHIIRMVAARWLGQQSAAGRLLICDPASVGVLGFEHDSPDEPIIRLWNCA